jgi:hypothetical protein
LSWALALFQRGRNRARKTVLVSDLSGKEIEDGKDVKVRITFADARSGSIELDVTADEARQMGRKGSPGSSQGTKAEIVLARRRESLKLATLALINPVLPHRGCRPAARAYGMERIVNVLLSG